MTTRWGMLCCVWWWWCGWRAVAQCRQAEAAAKMFELAVAGGAAQEAEATNTFFELLWSREVRGRARSRGAKQPRLRRTRPLLAMRWVFAACCCALRVFRRARAGPGAAAAAAAAPAAAAGRAARTTCSRCTRTGERVAPSFCSTRRRNRAFVRLPQAWSAPSSLTLRWGASPRSYLASPRSILRCSNPQHLRHARPHARLRAPPVPYGVSGPGDRARRLCVCVCVCGCRGTLRASSSAAMLRGAAFPPSRLLRAA